ncbi:SusD/RagB family nutrient-binding outer membrane lipoprotein [Chitinophaga polysaccharea]|uniref:SusD/RagB family nutrient-binding outer membrane lipoprotein n=1 Tax=Chitinophaga TaxID=79328 RepID=UPI001455A676|nr:MULTISPECIES: SusD/RagB family nutrient-binding outer membrane lipoprotein [Chitinophaga]NLR61634.1 SusD/RagB family nutrient-binding outer membrane lipoprotein [Chitinophaga polysaccharea]NLU93771.1 SusD/RagB family nutrient-binding outer membrane lipoprotein [Chitinophaga sp. Ak27]
MKKTKIFSLLSVSALLLFSGGCKKFLDVNTDPNNAVDVPVDLLLPSAQTGLTFALGNTLTINGGIWAQYWTQSPAASQYQSLEQYSPSQGDFDNVWFNLHIDALENFQKIVEKGNTTKQREYVALATILKVYTYQLVTDLWGDVPFNQTLQGDAGTQILYPKYDSQSDIYDGLVKMIDTARNLINLDDQAVPGADDLIYGGDMGKWLRFANTLKLKIGLRLASKAATSARAEAIVKSLQGADFLQPGESALQNFTATGGQQNPLYGAIAGPVLNQTQNLVASSTTFNFFNTNKDPRLQAFYSKATDGNYTSIPQGSYKKPPTTIVSPPSPITGANAKNAQSAFAPVRLMTDYESDFLQAEAIARGWLTGDAQAMYLQGISDNFDAFGVKGADTYSAQPSVAYPAAGSLDAKIKAIITQKWAAMCGNQTIEAWTEWRRTGYPSFFTISQDSQIGGGRFPGIFLYPNSEMTRNPNAPKSNHFVYDKVWWAQ